jgi:hypothetical protein
MMVLKPIRIYYSLTSFKFMEPLFNKRKAHCFFKRTLFNSQKWGTIFFPCKYMLGNNLEINFRTGKAVCVKSKTETV